MRTNIVHMGAGELVYEIRQIVEIGQNVSRLSGKPIAWENIGDPVQKGEKLPAWMKEIIVQAVREDSTYAYSPTRGLTETREFLAERLNREKGVRIHPDDIIFFNGLGDAVNKVYGQLRREARVIGPTPAYPTHSSAEAAHAGYQPITYKLDPARGWMPDLDELRNKVRYNESIAGIMIINPDNPTGAVFPREILDQMVRIAKDYDLFLVGDEIYINMVYNGKKCTHLSEVVGDVPAISLKGISKEFPWPGGRCGWMEVYNQTGNKMFQKYVKSILDAKMLEVCSTTLPQYVIPRIMGHAEYANWQVERNSFFERRSRRVAEILGGIPEIIVNPPDGAFYVSVVFKQELSNRMRMRIDNPAVQNYIDGLCTSEIEPDRKFVYHLLASRNICVVPLTSFVCNLQGFRCTLLERDDSKFEEIYHGIRDGILEFLNG
ncbi:MAG: pyridoxal phosphate-dependent aminotransferase [Spirochaetia bacterium]|nr:pyridoxal phosphate-dependent aminotransferase [Spirochaetia bacterium]